MPDPTRAEDSYTQAVEITSGAASGWLTWQPTISSSVWPGVSTDIWDYVVADGYPGRPEGFASDANIDTGTNGWISGMETCV